MPDFLCNKYYFSFVVGMRPRNYTYFGFELHSLNKIEPAEASRAFAVACVTPAPIGSNDIIIFEFRKKQKSIVIFKPLLYNKKEQHCISISKGMASRHLFTHIYLIRCASPAKVLLRKLLINGLAPLSRNARRCAARFRKLHLAYQRLCVSPYKIVLF